MSREEPADSVDAVVAADLAGEAVATLSPVRGGGNNRLFRLETVGGAVYAFKRYVETPGDRRDRFGVETGALVFLNRHGVTAVPRLIARDRASRSALFEWIDGETIAAPAPGEIDAALALIGQLQGLRTGAGAEGLPLASDACLSAVDLLAQIERRLARLAPALAVDARLHSLIEVRFRPLLTAYRCRCAEMYGRMGIALDEPIPAAQRTLSPSDFGFHNARRRAGGGVVFLDFEYFGWDDPVKLASDSLLHPGSALSGADRRRLAEGFRVIFRDGFFFAERLEALQPLFGLCWCLILLNEFLPDAWRRRRAATGLDDRERIRERQLDRSRRLLTALEAWRPGDDLIGAAHVMESRKPPP